MSDISYKVVAVGDKASLKTKLLITCVSDKFPENCIPTVFDNYKKELVVEGGEVITLNLFDTAGSDDYDKLRPLTYHDTKVVLAVFSIVKPETLERLKVKFIPEVRSHLGKEIPMILVGTEKEKREDEEVVKKLSEKRLKPISVEDGENLAKEMNIIGGYIEISSCDIMNNDDDKMSNVNEPFLRAAKIISSKKNQKKEGKSGCFVM